MRSERELKLIADREAARAEAKLIKRQHKATLRHVVRETSKALKRTEAGLQASDAAFFADALFSLRDQARLALKALG